MQPICDRGVVYYLPTQEGFHGDECHYHIGLKHQDGTPKLLYRSASGLRPVATMPGS